MGVSSDGQITYGVLLDETHILPWYDDKYDSDFERWWIEGVCGYEPPFQLFTEWGDWINTEDADDEAKISAYFSHRRAFKKEHPCPVWLRVHCSYDYPMYILAVGKGLVASRGSPKQFSPVELEMSVGKYHALLDFCKEHGIKFVEGPCWWLTSVYG